VISILLCTLNYYSVLIGNGIGNKDDNTDEEDYNDDPRQ